MRNLSLIKKTIKAIQKIQKGAILKRIKKIWLEKVYYQLKLSHKSYKIQDMATYTKIQQIPKMGSIRRMNSEKKCIKMESFDAIQLLSNNLYKTGIKWWWDVLVDSQSLLKVRTGATSYQILTMKRTIVKISRWLVRARFSTWFSIKETKIAGDIEFINTICDNNEIKRRRILVKIRKIRKLGRVARKKVATVVGHLLTLAVQMRMINNNKKLPKNRQVVVKLKYPKWKLRYASYFLQKVKRKKEKSKTALEDIDTSLGVNPVNILAKNKRKFGQSCRRKQIRKRRNRIGKNWNDWRREIPRRSWLYKALMKMDFLIRPFELVSQPIIILFTHLINEYISSYSRSKFGK